MLFLRAFLIPCGGCCCCLLLKLRGGYWSHPSLLLVFAPLLLLLLLLLPTYPLAPPGSALIYPSSCPFSLSGRRPWILQG